MFIYEHLPSADALFLLVPAVEKITADTAEDVDCKGDPEPWRVIFFNLLAEDGCADEIGHEAQHRTGDIRKVSHFRAAEVHADHITGKNSDRSHKKGEKETALFPELTNFIEFRIFCNQPLGEVQL